MITDRANIYSVSLSLRTVIKGSADQIGKPHMPGKSGTSSYICKRRVMEILLVEFLLHEPTGALDLGPSTLHG